MRRNTWLAIPLALAILLVWFATTAVGTTVKPAPEFFGGLNVTPLTQLREDPRHELSFEQIIQSPPAGAFQAIDGDRIEIGFSESTWWGRLKLPRQPSGQPFGLLEFTKPALSRIDAYFPVQGPTPGQRRWIKASGGEFVPVSQRPIAFRCTVFAIPPGVSPDDYVYFRIKTLVSVNTKLVLWPTEAFISAGVYDNMAFGAIYGVLLAMGLYNLILFMSLRDRVYLMYVIYDISIIAYIASTYGHIALVPLVSGLLGPRSQVVIGVMSLLAGTVFVRAFLNIKKTSRGWDIATKLFMLTICLGLLPNAMGMPNLSNKLLTFITLGTGVAFLILASDYLHRGFRPALFLVIAWSCFMLGVCLFCIGGIFIPRSLLTIYTLPVGATLDAVLLSFALADRIRNLEVERADLDRSRRHFMELASRDGLTGLFNRRYIIEQLQLLVAQHQDQQRQLSLLMIDVDDFKTFNDAHGHLEGDRVLVTLADIISQGIRARDKACRYGGEEFMVLLPDSTHADAIKVAERIRTSFGRECFFIEGSAPCTVTISIGAASINGADDSFDGLVGRADRALYQAKNLGKNRTVSFREISK